MRLGNAQLIAASAVAVAFTGGAQATLWDQGGGSDTSYNNPLNWDGDVVPETTFVEIKDATDVVTIDSVAIGGRVFFENNPTLNVQADGTFGGGSMGFRSGIINQSAGNFNINQSGALPFGDSGGWDGVTTALNLSGGTININGAGATTAITNNFGSAINTGQASGDLDISWAMGSDSGGIGIFNVSGGFVRSRVGVALAANSEFNVIGSASDIGIGENNTFNGSWYQATDALLSFGVDDGGVSTVRIDQGTSDTVPVKHVAFEDGAILDLSILDGTAAPTVETSYTLMLFELGDIKNDQTGLAGTGLVFADDVDDTLWSVSVDNSGVDGLLIATYTPGVMTSLVGDYNGDGFVSQGDLDLVLLNWGNALAPAGFDETNLQGGGPFDGLMSQNELDGVLLNWGNGTAPGVAAVPEPTSLAMIGLGTFALIRRRV